MVKSIKEVWNWCKNTPPVVLTFVATIAIAGSFLCIDDPILKYFIAANSAFAFVMLTATEWIVFLERRRKQLEHMTGLLMKENEGKCLRLMEMLAEEYMGYGMKHRVQQADRLYRASKFKNNRSMSARKKNNSKKAR